MTETRKAPETGTIIGLEYLSMFAIALKCSTLSSIIRLMQLPQ